jgi:pilus assembly protein CpaB
VFRFAVRRPRQAQAAEPQRRRLRRPPAFPVRTLVVAGLGVTGLMLLVALLGSAPSGRDSREALVELVVAAVPIQEGTKISPEMLTVQRVPLRRAPQDAVLSMAEAAGRAAARTIAQGEPITRSVLQVPDQLGGGQQVAPGMQAVSVVLSEPDALMGRVRPGDVVDLLATFYQPVPATRVVASAVPVLAVARIEIPQQGVVSDQRQQQPGRPRDPRAVVVTVAVPASAVPDVVLGSHAGRLAISVRDPREPAAVPSGGEGGSSVPRLVSGLLPKEEKASAGTQAPVQTPPPPKVSRPAMKEPPQVVQLPLPEPSRATAQRAEPAPASGVEGREPSWVASRPRGSTEGRREENLRPVEVIRGSSVSVELVSAPDGALDPRSAASRNRTAQPGQQQGQSDQPPQQPAQQQYGGTR